MMKWEDICDYIRKKYKPVAETTNSLTLECEFPDGAVQSVRVTFLPDRAGGPGLEISAPVATGHSFAPEFALAYNLMAPRAALALSGQTFILRQILELEDVSVDSIASALKYFSIEAVRVGRRAKTPPAAVELFSYLAS